MVDVLIGIGLVWQPWRVDPDPSKCDTNRTPPSLMMVDPTTP